MNTDAMILIVSNSRDFATDYVVARLLARQLPYLRIDLDLLADERVSLDPASASFTLERDGKSLTLDFGTIQSIYYRAPTHLRESSGGRYGADVLLARHQWTAFARSLMVFESPLWVNNPWQTFRAENKPFQLRTAAQLGFLVPETRICNAVPTPSDIVWRNGREVVVKALDPFLLRVSDDEDAFFYTRTVSAEEAESYSVSEMPVIFQERIEPKIDLRVTVVGEHVFPVAISLDGREIEGDWRLKKQSVSYCNHDLPETVRMACVRMVSELGLVFGAIDLALRNGAYYFLEINPTT